jgi:protein TonB
MRLARVSLLLAFVSLLGFGQDADKKISRAEALQAATTKVQPEYPAMALQLKIEGIVDLEAVVSDNGSVEKVNIVSGNPVLTKPAAEALKKWKFRPFVADGKPVRVVAPVSINFKRP